MGPMFLQHTGDTAWSAIRLYFEPLCWAASRISRRAKPGESCVPPRDASESRVATHVGESEAGRRSREQPIKVMEDHPWDKCAQAFTTIHSHTIVPITAERSAIRFDVDGHEEAHLYLSELRKELDRVGLGAVVVEAARQIGPNWGRITLTVVSESSPSAVRNAVESYLNALTLEARLDMTLSRSDVTSIVAALAREPMGTSVIRRIRANYVSYVRALRTSLEGANLLGSVDQSAILAELDRSIEKLAAIEKTLGDQ